MSSLSYSSIGAAGSRRAANGTGNGNGNGTVTAAAGIDNEEHEVQPSIHHIHNKANHQHLHESIHEHEYDYDHVIHDATLLSSIIDLLLFSLPLILAWQTQYMMITVTYIYLGHLDEEDTQVSLGGGSLAVMYTNISGISIIWGLGTGMETLAAQAFGSLQLHTIGRIAVKSMILLLLSSIPIICLWMYTEEILVYFGQQADIAYISGQWTRAYVWGLYPYILYDVCRKFLTAQRYAVPLLYIGVCSIVVHLLSCYMYIYYWNLGAVGTAYGMVTAYTFMCITVVIYTYMSGIGGRCFPHRIEWKALYDVNEWRNLLSLSIPGCIMLCAEWWGMEIISLFAGMLGSSILDVFVLSYNVVAVSFTVPLGLALGTATLVGNKLGQGNARDAQTTATACIIIGVIWICTTSTTYLLFTYPLASLFTNDSEVIHLLVSIAPFTCMLLIFDGLQGCLQGIIRGVGLQSIGAYINILGYYVISLPLCLFLSFYYNLKVEGLLIGFCCGSVFIALYFLLAFFSIDWYNEVLNTQKRVEEESQQCRVLDRETIIMNTNGNGNGTNHHDMNVNENTPLVRDPHKRVENYI